MNDERITRWRALVEASPEDELARFTLARACMERGLLEEARDHFRKAIELKSDWMMAHILLARCLIELDDPGPARPVLEEARRLAQVQGHKDPLAEIDEMLAETRP